MSGIGFDDEHHEFISAFVEEGREMLDEAEPLDVAWAGVR